MLKIHEKVSSDCVTLAFQGEATVASAAEALHSFKTFEPLSRRVVLDGSGIEECDLSFLQILEVARLEAASQKKMFSFKAGAVSPALRSAGLRSGFVPEKSCCQARNCDCFEKRFLVA